MQLDLGGDGETDEKTGGETVPKMVGLSLSAAGTKQRINKSFSGEGITHKIITRIKKQAWSQNNTGTSASKQRWH